MYFRPNTLSKFIFSILINDFCHTPYRPTYLLFLYIILILFSSLFLTIFPKYLQIYNIILDLLKLLVYKCECNFSLLSNDTNITQKNIKKESEDGKTHLTFFVNFYPFIML